MSWLPTTDPDCTEDCPEQVDMVIVPRSSDIGNFEVMRALPFRNRRMVGPFIFWDQMGPGELLTGQGIDVRPHPHIGLSTVTYLLDGTMDHKDSLGSDVRIKPGDVNLMSAGAGIVHSERTGQDIRRAPSRLYGIQSWIAQPKTHEYGRPSFSHTDKANLPIFTDTGIEGRVILGDFHGVKSPVPLEWDTLYIDVCLKEGAEMLILKATEERAIYGMSGQIEIGGTVYDAQQMMVLHPGKDVVIRAVNDARIMVLGGAVMDGPRYIFWNFVASSKERLEEAKQDWKNGRFPQVPGDDKEFIPLPE